MGVMEDRRRVMIGAPHPKTDSTSPVIETENAVRCKAKALSTSFAYSQNLNGYSEPWLGGEGKNLFDPNTESTLWVNTSSQLVNVDHARTCTISIPSNYTDYPVVLSSDVDASTEYVYLIAFLDSSDNVISRSVSTSGSFLMSTVPSSDTAKCIAGFYHYTTSGITEPLLELGSSASSSLVIPTYTPYENYCPITGYSGVEVVATGKNLMHGLVVGEGYDGDTGAIYTSKNTAMSAKIPVDFSKNTYYTLKMDGPALTSLPYTMILAWDEDGNYVGRAAGSANNPYRVKYNSFSFGANGNRNYDHIKYIAVRWYTVSSRTVYTLNSATIQLQAGYDATDYEPFGEVIDVSFVGKNLFDKYNATVYDRAINPVAGKWIPYDAKSFVFPCKTNTDYAVTAVASNLPLFRIAYITETAIAEDAEIIVYEIKERSSEGSLQIHTGNDATYIVMQPTGAYADIVKIQVEEGSTATSYEPYVGESYNGTLNVRTGVLSLSSYMYSFNGTEGWSHSWGTSSRNGVARLNDIPVVPKSNNNSGFIANFGKYGNVTSGNTNHGIYFHLTSKYINIRNSMVDYRGSRTAAQVRDEWKAFLAQRYNEGRPLQILLNLSTPIEYQLTPHEVQLIAGKNTVYSDTENCTLTYYGY